MTPAAALLLGERIGSALAEIAEVDCVVSENGNGTWYEVRLEDGSLCTVSIEAETPAAAEQAVTFGAVAETGGTNDV